MRTPSRRPLGIAAGVVLLRQKGGCPAVAAVGLGQHVLLGIVPDVSIPVPGFPEVPDDVFSSIQEFSLDVDVWGPFPDT
eukprot:7684132-Pyramimonas_sp.AAC.1